MTADDIIKLLDLELLPGEGGWFRETYREGRIPASALPRYGGDRTFGTQIYYLLRSGSVSKLHRVKSDEVFHYYLGSSVTQLRVAEDMSVSTVSIGPDLAAGERPQAIVPAGVWQGAILRSDLQDKPDTDAFALLGCTVSPGFEWEDFELIDRSAHADVIDSACRAHPWADRLA